jgi:hypothetical protein
MCDVCKTVEAKLGAFLNELENEFPGTEVEGQKVPRSHHVFVATLSHAQRLLVQEYDEMDKLYPPTAEELFAQAAMNTLLSGGKISEGN